jgi:hypothetical protein
MATDLQAATLLTKMRFHFPEADVFGYEELIPAMGNHPKDRHVLAAVVAAGFGVPLTRRVSLATILTNRK